MESQANLKQQLLINTSIHEHIYIDYSSLNICGRDTEMQGDIVKHFSKVLKHSSYPVTEVLQCEIFIRQILFQIISELLKWSENRMKLFYSKLQQWYIRVGLYRNVMKSTLQASDCFLSTH